MEICTYVVPVIHKDMPKVNIIIGTCRAIDQNSSKEPVPSLHVEVRVIPAGAILDSAPRVGQRIAGGNRALSDTRRPVHLVRAVLADSVEVNTSTIILQ